MKRLLFLSLLFAVVPLFAGDINFIYYNYDYNDHGYYDEYWYDDYWYDGHWVYMPYGYYCVHYVWWYPWWWDWYWARCHWVHHWSWDFFYAGFYVVWYDHGSWWYRPRYGHYVRHRLPHSYHTVRVRARTHGIYLPEKPPRELNVPYRQNQIRQLVKQQDPELYSRVEKEHRNGNLERMRKEHVEQVNREIVVKNREHGIKDRNIDINELSKQSRSMNEVKSTNPQRIRQESKTTTPKVEYKSTSKKTSSNKTSSRIQRTSKTESKTRKESQVRSNEPVEQSRSRERNVPERYVERPSEKEKDQKNTPQRTKEKDNKPTQKSRTNTPQVQRQQERRPPQPRLQLYNQTNQRENKR
ncbi:MAG: hypothetical protein WBE28_08155 [bacterium]